MKRRFEIKYEGKIKELHDLFSVLEQNFHEQFNPGWVAWEVNNYQYTTDDDKEAILIFSKIWFILKDDILVLQDLLTYLLFSEPLNKKGQFCIPTIFYDTFLHYDNMFSFLDNCQQAYKYHGKT